MDFTILQAFLSVYQEKSFSAAALRLGISRSMVSKHISTLEADLGARVFVRSTRTVKPTDLGTQYHSKIKPLMDDLKAATEEVRDSVRKPLGKLRIGAPVWYMLRVMQPAIMRFMAAYPDVELDLVLDEGNHDLVNSGLDALVHFGSLPDTDLHALRVHSVQAILIASPEYLAEAGTPVTPPDLAGHRCLHHSYAPGNDSWSFSHQGQIIRQKIRPVLTVNNAEVLRMAALDGQGITLALWLFVEEDIKAGRLVQVLEDFTFPDLDVNIVHAGRRQATGALRAFLEFMAAQHVDCERQSP